MIIRENIISTTRNKDHVSASLAYMLFFLSKWQQFNLSYYVVNRIINVKNRVNKVLTYGMLLTHLYRHVKPLALGPLYLYLGYNRVM